MLPLKPVTGVGVGSAVTSGAVVGSAVWSVVGCTSDVVESVSGGAAVSGDVVSVLSTEGVEAGVPQLHRRSRLIPYEIRDKHFVVGFMVSFIWEK